MFKRIFWMSTGVAVGATGAFWAKRRVEETIERYLPEQVAERAAISARGLGETMRAAAQEGRDAMRATEAELRARVDDKTFVGERPVPPAPAATTHRRSSRTSHGRRGGTDRRPTRR